MTSKQDTVASTISVEDTDLTQNTTSVKESPKEVVVDKSVTQLIIENIKKYKSFIAQKDAVTGKEETYEELHSKSIRMAQNLLKKGISSGDIISMCTYNNMEYVIPIFASFFIGAISAPMDPTSPLLDIIHCLKLTTPKIIFCEEELESMIEEAIKEAELSIEIVVFGGSKRNTSFSELLVPQEPEESFKYHEVTDYFSTACIHFSSGTTGYPKGVCVNHYSLVYIVLQLTKGVTKSKVYLIVTSPFWISNMNSMLYNLACGDTRIVCKKFDEKTFIKYIQDYHVNICHITPVNGAKLLQNPENYENYDLSSLWILATGGSTTPPKQFLEYGKILPSNVLIICGYGMTETGGMILSCKALQPSELAKYKYSFVGSHLPGFEYKVVDTETEEICGPHKEGELRVKYAGVMREYYRNPEAYKKAFDSDGYLKTGDIVYYDESYNYYYVTRIKDIFKYLGWHISPLIIESELLKHPNIIQAVVFGVPSEMDGEYPTAAVVVKDKDLFNEEEIKKYIQNCLPDRYHLRGGVFQLDSIPTTSSGKIQKRKLTEMVLKMKNYISI